jgi:hypothetical protein
MSDLGHIGYAAFNRIPVILLFGQGLSIIDLELDPAVSGIGNLLTPGLQGMD